MRTRLEKDLARYAGCVEVGFEGSRSTALAQSASQSLGRRPHKSAATDFLLREVTILPDLQGPPSSVFPISKWIRSARGVPRLLLARQTAHVLARASSSDRSL